MTIEVDWSAPKTKCQTPGCNHPTWHICLYGQTDLDKVVPKAAKETPDWRKLQLQEITKERWAKQREKDKPRDAAIVARYKEIPIGIEALCKEFGVSNHVIRRVLHEAADRGEVNLRPKGRTLARGAK